MDGKTSKENKPVEINAWKKKDWIDQPLHFASGFFIAWIIFIFTHLLPESIILSAAFGAIREMRQHKRLIILNLDLCFWYAGAVGFIFTVLNYGY